MKIILALKMSVALPAAIAVLAGTTTVAALLHRAETVVPRPAASADGEKATILQALVRAGSDTPEQWVAMADAVVIARVTEETRLPAPRSETAAGDGVDLVGRSVTLEIDKVLWREKSTSTEPRGSITLNVSGWLSDGKTDREVVTGARSRLEVGHTYVVAMSWMRAECDEGDPVQPAGWEPIGGGGVLPADDGVIGRGEYLGAMVDRPDQGDVPSGSVLAATTGRSPEDVVSLLEDTEPVKRIDVQADLRPCNE